MTTYRVWYRPYLLADEEDFMDITAETEKEAIERARTCGWVSYIEMI